ncbi:MAG: hypothetical protein AB7N65_26200 [Vicinamibacterales bacterium]
MDENLSVRVRRRGAVIAALVAAIAVPVAGQSAAGRPKASSSSTVSRTPDGRPDLQGVWFFGTLTPLQRPDSLAGRTHLTDAEIAEIETRSNNRPESFALFGDYPKYVFDKRTSLVVDPPDGKVPAMTPAGQKRQDVRSAARRAADNPEDLPVYERCILGFNAGPPIIPGGYNQNVQLVQTRDYVVIHTEMVHTARIVRLDGSPRLPTHIRQWNGDSRGQWDGDTLVVTTTNFTSTGTGTLMLDGNLARTGIGWSPDENMTLVERFTLANSDTLIYEFTIDDPTVWTKPWTVSLPMTRSNELIYEYACHEGNYDMRYMLSGARVPEKAGDAPLRTGSEPNPR